MRWFRFFGVVAALFAAADAAMGPQTFEDHFGCGRGGACVFAVLDAEAVDMLHQALGFCQLLMALVGGGEVRELDFAAELEPLDHGLEAEIGEGLAEEAAEGGASGFAWGVVPALCVALV